LKEEGEERKRQHMWPDHKRYSKRGSWYILHGKRYRSIVTSRVYLQKIHSYLKEGRSQKRL